LERARRRVRVVRVIVVVVRALRRGGGGGLARGRFGAGGAIGHQFTSCSTLVSSRFDVNDAPSALHAAHVVAPSFHQTIEPVPIALA
jgi:hypothetical protein